MLGPKLIELKPEATRIETPQLSYSHLQPQQNLKTLEPKFSTAEI